MNLLYILQQEKLGDYSIYSPHFPISSSGETKKEALANFREALDLFQEYSGKEIFTSLPKTELGTLSFHA